MIDESAGWATTEIFRGVYSAERAAALSGVPRSTLYYWARHDVWKPSLSTTRPKLWTYGDVLAVRVIHWLRHPKPDDSGREIKASTMAEVRSALEAIKGQGHAIWDGEVRVFVDRSGRVFFRTSAGTWAGQQAVLDGDYLELFEQFSWRSGIIGPNLVHPRPTLRIIPGKLAGEPHVTHTRIATRRLFALAHDGLDQEVIQTLYPDLSAEAIDDAVDLEEQLLRNVA